MNHYNNNPKDPRGDSSSSNSGNSSGSGKVQKRKTIVSMADYGYHHQSSPSDGSSSQNYNHQYCQGCGCIPYQPASHCPHQQYQQQAPYMQQQPQQQYAQQQYQQPQYQQQQQQPWYGNQTWYGNQHPGNFDENSKQHGSDGSDYQNSHSYEYQAPAPQSSVLHQPQENDWNRTVVVPQQPDHVFVQRPGPALPNAATQQPPPDYAPMLLESLLEEWKKDKSSSTVLPEACIEFLTLTVEKIEDRLKASQSPTTSLPPFQVYGLMEVKSNEPEYQTRLAATQSHLSLFLELFFGALDPAVKGDWSAKFQVERPFGDVARRDLTSVFLSVDFTRVAPPKKDKGPIPATGATAEAMRQVVGPMLVRLLNSASFDTSTYKDKQFLTLHPSCKRSDPPLARVTPDAVEYGSLGDRNVNNQSDHRVMIKVFSEEDATPFKVGNIPFARTPAEMAAAELRIFEFLCQGCTASTTEVPRDPAGARILEFPGTDLKVKFYFRPLKKQPTWKSYPMVLMVIATLEAKEALCAHLARVKFCSQLGSWVPGCRRPGQRPIFPTVKVDTWIEFDGERLPNSKWEPKWTVKWMLHEAQYDAPDPSKWLDRCPRDQYESGEERYLQVRVPGYIQRHATLEAQQALDW